MQLIGSRKQRKLLGRIRGYSTSTNKSRLWLITLILVTPASTDQTVIKQADKSENTTIDIQPISNRKEYSYLPYDDNNFSANVNFSRQTKDESSLHIASYLPTNKEKESNLNDTKSVNDTVFNSKDGHITFETAKNGSASKYREEHNVTESNYQTVKDYKISCDRDERKAFDNFGNHQESKKEPDLKVEQRDIANAVHFGVMALEELVKIKEPHLYKLGLFLNENDPAAKVANFGAPSSRKAILMSRIGYATLEASRKIAETFVKDVGRQSPGIHIGLQSRIDIEECPLRGLPRCPAASRRFRTSDGTCNNLENPWRGSAMLPMQRFLPPVYDDGIQSIRRSILATPLPSPREISTAIHRDKNQEIRSVTLMFMQWGQFIDHDLTSTVKSRSFNGSIPRCCEGGGRSVLPPEFLHPSCLPIEVPRTDPFLSRFGVGCMEFIRSAPSTRINCELGWREQINQVTPYLDASTIYGSDIDTSDSIRTFRNGKIFYGRSDQQPLNPPDPPGGELCSEGALSEECLQAGDNRVSENPGLIAMHTVFVRYHNKVATVLSKVNPHWSDERVFQETRRIVYSVIQHITYREYLPVVLGPEVMDLFELRVLKKGYYDKYDMRVNAAIANSFSTAAFRFGHSMVQNSFIRTDSHHIPLSNNVSLHNEISNFENIWSFGAVDRFLLGLSNQPSQKRDEFMADELTNHLFQFSDSVPFGMDLAAINIQRGRDHGIPPYTFWRKPCGLSPIEGWRDLERVMSISAVMRLRTLYVHIDDIDLFTAGLAEKPLKGAVVGPTFACIIAQQFSNLRKGDRFWYENEAFESSFSPAQLQQIRQVSLAQIMCQTMNEIETIQPFVFLSADNFRNIRVSCESPEIRRFDLQAWAEASFEFNSISNNPDLFEQERSQQDLTRLKRENVYNYTETKDVTDRGSDNEIGIINMLKGLDDLFTVPELETNTKLTTYETIKTNLTELKRERRQISRSRQETNVSRSKKNKNSTEQPRIATTKTKTNSSKKIHKNRSTTKIPHLTSKTDSAEAKYDKFSNVPNKPNFSLYSTTRPTKNKPNYYQTQHNDHDDMTYLLGFVPERSTKPSSAIPIQLNINIHYSPQPTGTSANNKKRPNSSTRPGFVNSDDYVTSKPTNAYRPTQTYGQNDIVVITKRPVTSTRRPSVTSHKPEAVSYPVFMYSPAYDKPNNYEVSTKKPGYFFDNIEYASTNGHKRPNNNGLGLVRPRPTSNYGSNIGSNSNNVVKLPHSSYRPTTEYFDNDDDYDEEEYISSSNYQNSYDSVIFEDRPFSTSNRPTYTDSNKYSNKYSTKKPTFNSHYFDDDGDSVIVAGNKRRPQGNIYNRDEFTATDDILNEFFERHGEQMDGTNRKATDDSTPRTNINDKLDFKSRILYRTLDNKRDKNEDRFVQISAVKKEVFGRETDDAFQENIPEATVQGRQRRSVKKIRIVDIDVIPSEPSGQWKVFNATEEVPFKEIPELPMNIPCSYEVPKPMTEFLPSPESANNTKAR